jgi:hypothetical protein
VQLLVEVVQQVLQLAQVLPLAEVVQQVLQLVEV